MMSTPEAERRTPAAPAVNLTTRQLLESREFKRLVTARWRVSMLLSAILAVIYYGYILLVATNKPLLARRIGDTVTFGIPLGAGIIVAAWLLTAVYVVWANRRYDPDVRRLKERLRQVQSSPARASGAGAETARVPSPRIRSSADLD